MLLRDASEEYMLSRETADTIIGGVCAALKDWSSLATRLGITKREISIFADRWQLSTRLNLQ